MGRIRADLLWLDIIWNKISDKFDSKTLLVWGNWKWKLPCRDFPRKQENEKQVEIIWCITHVDFISSHLNLTQVLRGNMRYINSLIQEVIHEEVCPPNKWKSTLKCWLFTSPVVGKILFLVGDNSVQNWWTTDIHLFWSWPHGYFLYFYLFDIWYFSQFHRTKIRMLLTHSTIFNHLSQKS